jgi:SMP-30/Gluconolactonase/LRE-like region
LTLGADGTLYVAQNGGVFGASGTAEPGVQVISDRRVNYLVAGMGAPNDLVFGPDGRLWVTDIRREIDPALPGDGLPGQVWAVDVASASAGMVVEAGPVFVNGLGFTRDKRTLLVTATLLSEFLALSTAGCGAGHEHQSKFADLHLVAVGQHSRVHGFTVDIDAGEAADVDNPEFGVDAPELGVPVADGAVVEEDIAIRVTSGRRDGLVE